MASLNRHHESIHGWSRLNSNDKLRCDGSKDSQEYENEHHDCVDGNVDVLMDEGRGWHSSSNSDFLEVVQNFFPIHFQFSKSANSITEATSQADG